MGAVTLLVGDLDGLTAYYRDALGLTVLRAVGNEVTLGRGTSPLVVLRHDPTLPSGSRRSAGLFHTAILFADHAALAAAVLSAVRYAPSAFVGSADHLVSEAFYFTDPEGNGIELYVDRPREEWTWSSGQLHMDTLALDPNDFLARHLTDAAREGAPSAAGATVGHVHLQVGDTAVAREFYVDTLGFEATIEMRGALFVSAGGYHHHMAMNTWNSAGAGPRVPALGLGRVDIVLPGADDVTALRSRLRSRGLDVRDDGASLEVEDPWRNLVRVTTPAA
ncbi:VOC family protein [Georgenia wangjunii]|uniref:VOC family protein n=1 Tax=Georgenia wangjunii TaxID=3117730 RepID=UPI002F2607A6